MEATEGDARHSMTLGWPATKSRFAGDNVFYLRQSYQTRRSASDRRSPTHACKRCGHRRAARKASIESGGR